MPFGMKLVVCSGDGDQATVFTLLAAAVVPTEYEVLAESRVLFERPARVPADCADQFACATRVIRQHIASMGAIIICDTDERLSFSVRITVTHDGSSLLRSLEIASFAFFRYGLKLRSGQQPHSYTGRRGCVPQLRSDRQPLRYGGSRCSPGRVRIRHPGVLELGTVAARGHHNIIELLGAACDAQRALWDAELLFRRILARIGLPAADVMNFLARG